jgi:hypothetical protein
VIEPLNQWTCTGCGGSGSYLFMEGPGPLCLDCADMAHLVFPPAGNTALSRRAKLIGRTSTSLPRRPPERSSAERSRAARNPPSIHHVTRPGRSSKRRRSGSAAGRKSPSWRCTVTPAGVGRSCEGGATEMPPPNLVLLPRRSGHRHVLAMPRALAQAMGMVGQPRGAPSQRVSRQSIPGGSRRGSQGPWRRAAPAGGPSGKPPAPCSRSHTAVLSKNAQVAQEVTAAH